MGIIGDRTVSYTDILSVFNASYPNKSIDYVTERLIGVGAIEKIVIEQDNDRSKPYYRIKDNAMRFFYSYLNAPFANRLLFTPADYYRTFVEKSLKQDFIPHMFEKAGLEFIAMMNRKGLLPDRLLDLYPCIIHDRKTKTSYQFGVVGESENGRINYECKFRAAPIGTSVIEEGKRQAEMANANFIKTVFIGKAKIPDVESYDLADMFSDCLL